MEVGSLELLDEDTELAQREFLDEPHTDDEEDDSEFADDADAEFDEQLEFAGEITLTTGSASSDDAVAAYLAKGCGCKKLCDGPCSRALTPEDVSNYRLAITELESSEVDLTILAQLHSGMNAGELLTNTRGTARPSVCQRVTFQYSFKGQPICREMFLFLHQISITRLYNIVKHLFTNGIVPRTHGNKGRMAMSEYAQITCPKPILNNPDQTVSTAQESCIPPVKRARLCSHCRLPGHTKSVRGKITCPQLL